jgi:hypothetical protein
MADIGVIAKITAQDGKRADLAAALRKRPQGCVLALQHRDLFLRDLKLR